MVLFVGFDRQTQVKYDNMELETLQEILDNIDNDNLPFSL